MRLTGWRFWSFAGLVFLMATGLWATSVSGLFANNPALLLTLFLGGGTLLIIYAAINQIWHEKLVDRVARLENEIDNLKLKP